MIIERDLFLQASQAVNNFSQKYQKNLDIPASEVNQLLTVMKECNEAISNESLEGQAVTDLSSALRNFPAHLKSNQERVALLLASLIQEKAKLENNIKDKERLGHKVEKPGKSKEY